MRELLLTIHGIHNKGSWQEDLTEVLEPHFDCKALKYRGYWLAGSAILAGPAIGISALLVIGLLYALGRVNPPWAIGLAICAVALSVAGWLMPLLTRYKIRREIARAKKPYLTPPHLIAHSFGTHLCCWALNNYEAIRFRHIILVGSVLPRGFSWATNLSSFRSVRNEVGLRDWVVRLVQPLRSVRPSFGISGASGFGCDDELCHDQDDSWTTCERCNPSKKARIHNVKNNGEHWMELMTGDHPRELWLPILWGHQPGHYSQYLELCSEGHQALNDGHVYKAGQVQQDFAARVWDWTAGQRCDDYLHTLLETHLAECNRDLSRPEGKRAVVNIIYKIWLAVLTAKAESQKARDIRNDKIIRYMRPEWLYEEMVRVFVMEMT